MKKMINKICKSIGVVFVICSLMGNSFPVMASVPIYGVCQNMDESVEKEQDKHKEVFERLEQKTDDIYDNLYAQMENELEQDYSLYDLAEAFVMSVYDFYRLIKTNLWVLLSVLWLFCTVIYMVFKTNKAARKSILKSGAALTLILLCFTYGGGVLFG